MRGTRPARRAGRSDGVGSSGRTGPCQSAPHGAQRRFFSRFLDRMPRSIPLAHHYLGHQAVEWEGALRPPSRRYRPDAPARGMAPDSRRRVGASCACATQAFVGPGDVSPIAKSICCLSAIWCVGPASCHASGLLRTVRVHGPVVAIVHRREDATLPEPIQRPDGRRRTSEGASVGWERSTPDPARSLDTQRAWLNRSAKSGRRSTTCGVIHIMIPGQPRHRIPPSR